MLKLLLFNYTEFFYTLNFFFKLNSVLIFIIWTPLYNMATSVNNMSNSVYVEATIIWTPQSIIWTPLQYGHLSQ